MLKNNKDQKRGFTMIELLIVMSIIAILSAISIFALQGARSSGRDAKRKADLESIRSALEIYRADCGEYFPFILPFGSQWSYDCDGEGGPITYLEVVPSDPSGSSHPDYDYDPGANNYCLCATLENPPDPPDNCGGATGNYCVTNP